ncbi:MAG: flagellar motor switch protein FliN [Planctomycetota bacterium]|nr:flagellar motor switch protein FliN [Planctomycetota bacterium]MCZ6492785.1 flagellar motor switch protein FliN [Planctomycetota bacterium]MCZ6611332.1 flagellar motor switch protein FliN [Planctomycetota bacterium]MCZ6811042.1 flagellar motor switch protein FliN [Planctomycetota bacterium]MCZ6852077.1 flagellar motor switch protein FliN [Planctomycetota bacterium]
MADETPNVEQSESPEPAEKPADSAPPTEAEAAADPLDDRTAAQVATEAIDKAEQAVQDIKAESSGPGAVAEALNLPDLDGPPSGDGVESAGLDLLGDVNLQVKVELGRTRMYVEDVLRLNENSVIELDKLAGDPVDIYVNDRHVARGEVLVVNENFCVRVSEIIQLTGPDD